MRRRLAGLLQQLAALMRAPINDAGRYTQVWASLGSCEEMLARVALEPNWQQIEGEHELITLSLQGILAQAREILLASSDSKNALSSHATGLAASGATLVTDIRERAARAVQSYADELADVPGAAPARADALLAGLPRVLDTSRGWAATRLYPRSFSPACGISLTRCPRCRAWRGTVPFRCNSRRWNQHEFATFPCRAVWPRRLIAVLACGLSACAWIHDNVPPATMVAPEKIRLADDIRLARDGWPQAHWWKRYHNRQLDTFIDLALEQAPGILVARRRVEQAGAQVGVVQATSRLKAEAIATVDRQHVSANGFLAPFALNEPALGFTGPWYTQGIVGVAGSYAFDLWGKERSAVEAAIGKQNAQLAEQAAVELELSADVAQQYFAMQSIRQKLALLLQARDIQAAVVAAASAREDRGLGSKTPVAMAQALLFQMDQQITLAQTEVR